jgi:hypothetical protein
MASIYYLYDTNADYNSRKSGKKIHPYFRTAFSGLVRTAYPRIFKRLSDYKQHLVGNQANYEALGKGIVLIRVDLEASELSKDYLVMTAETCKCGEIKHHAVGIEVYCPDQKCPESSMYESPEEALLRQARAGATMKRARGMFP